MLIIGVTVVLCLGIMLVDVEGVDNAEYWAPFVSVLIVGKVAGGFLCQLVVQKANFLLEWP